MGLSNQRIFNVFHKVLPSLDFRNKSLKSIEERVSKTLKISAVELRMIAGAILLSSLVVALLSLSNSDGPAGVEGPAEITTFIPAGQVIVPIQPKNFESLDSILGPFGYADLFISDGPKPSRLFAKNVRILRAPKNPSLFAVLVSQDHSATVLEANEKGIYVVIKTKSSDGTVFVNDLGKASRTKPSRISYSSEDS